MYFTIICLNSSIGAILVYDITKLDSFTNIKSWLNEIKTYSHEKINIMMVGNKTDLEGKWTIFFLFIVNMGLGGRLVEKWPMNLLKKTKYFIWKHQLN